MKAAFLPKHASQSSSKRGNELVKITLTCFTAVAVVLLVYNHARFISGISSSWTASAAALQQSGQTVHPGTNTAADVVSLPAAAAALAASLQQPMVSKQQAAAAVPALVEGQPEVWAAGPQQGDQQQQLQKLLDAETLAQLKSLCGRCLYRTLTSYVRTHDFGRLTVVLTGDIPAMWVRDSAVQMASYFPRISKRPGIRLVLEGAIRAQSYFILQVSTAQSEAWEGFWSSCQQLQARGSYAGHSIKLLCPWQLPVYSLNSSWKTARILQAVSAAYMSGTAASCSCGVYTSIVSFVCHQLW
jgi:hypothetical protein